jgi:hypothetical protein
VKEIFKTEKAPFLLGLLLAAITVQYNYLASYFQDSPIVEFQWRAEKEASSADSALYLCEIEVTNLSRSVKYDRIVFDVGWKHGKRDGSLYDPSIIPIEPATLGHEVDEFHNEAVSFEIHQFQPQTSLLLQFRTEQPANRLFYPGLYLSESSQAVQLREAGIVTFLFRHIFGINLVFALLLLLLTGFYFWQISKKKPQ